MVVLMVNITYKASVQRCSQMENLVNNSWSWGLQQFAALG